MADAASPLLPIRILTLETEFVGQIDPQGERLTDILQRGDPFQVLPLGAFGNPDDWIEMLPDEILLVVPPRHVSPPERRLQRQLAEVFVKVGEYEVTGTAHLIPGAEHDIVSRSSHPFLPLTDAVLGAPGSEPEKLEVVIVNLRQTSEYRVV